MQASSNEIAEAAVDIGVDGIVDKSPEIIAISAAAQVLQAVEANAGAHAAQTV